MLTDSSYYINDIQLSAGDYSTLLPHIERYEKEIINQLFGYELAKLVLAYDPLTSEQRIIDIVEGVEYSIDYNNRTQLIKWNGLINSDKKSILSYYTYYHYKRNNITLDTPSGEIKSLNENSKNADLSLKISNAWNNLEELVGYEGQSVLSGSLYCYLIEHIDDYPELIFIGLGSVNAFDL
jgi:hypothetical protein